MQTKQIIRTKKQSDFKIYYTTKETVKSFKIRKYKSKHKPDYFAECQTYGYKHSRLANNSSEEAGIAPAVKKVKVMNISSGLKNVYTV